MKTMLPSIDQERLNRYCEQHYIKKLLVFGSVIKGTDRPDSDVDLLVEFIAGRAPGFLAPSKMQRELSAICSRNVDLRTPNELSRYFRESVIAAAQDQYAQR